MQSASVADVLDSRLIEPVDARPAMTASDAANSANAPSNSNSPQLTQTNAVPVLNPNADDSASVGSLLNNDAVAADLLTTVDEQRSELRDATVDLRYELIFVDPTLTNADELVAGLLKSADNSRSFEVVMLDATKDGITQITEVLAAHNGIDAVHLVTHGSESAIKLGSTWLNAESLVSHAGDFAKWELSLTSNADLLVYGCNLASSVIGQELMSSLAALTGADVAASNDPTGNSQLGGNWDLELASGTIETQSLSAPEWMGTLAPLSFVQSYFVPLPDTNIRTAYTALGATTSAQINSVISIATSSSNTVIVYDQWEDGFEADLSNPTQTTTQIWGDGNLANGAAPGYASDIITPGGTIALQNLVSLPRNPATVLFDGGDRFGSTKAVAVTRAAWATSPGSVLGTAVDVYDTSKFGTNFKVPVGQNTPNMNLMFEYASLLVQASQNGTVIQIDKNGDGSVDLTQTLNMGETYQVNGGIMQGATLMSSKPVQAQLMTGDIGGTYESRSFTLAPTDQWSGSYYSPVSTTLATAPLAVFLYNPGAAAITVNYMTLASSGSISIAANSTSRFDMPMNSGAHFYSTGGAPFYAVGTMDSDAANHAAHDWGFRLIAEDNLTTAAVAGWAPGSSNLSANGSPLWVTAVNATRIYVDFDGNSTTGALTDPNGKKYDQHYDVSALQSQRIYDSSDNNQTGTKVYTIDGTLITAAWGQDPSVALPGNPYLDMGTAVLPLPASSIRKTSILLNDLDFSGTITPGDELQYSITTTNDGVVPLGNVIVSDIVPVGTTYVAGSTTFNGNPVLDQSGTTTSFPLDDLNNGTDEGLSIGNIAVGQSSVVSFAVQINDPYDGSALGIVNSAQVDTDESSLIVSVTTPLNATPGAVVFATSLGSATEAPSYQPNGTAYLTVTDPDPNMNSSVTETLTVLVTNPTTGDRETVTLTETGVNTGVFSAALPASISGGQLVDDGTIYALAGQTLTVSYTDPRYSTDTHTDTVTITTPSVIKQLYLSADGSGSPDQDLDRVDPVNTADGTTASSVTLSSASGTSTITQAAKSGTTDTDTSNNSVANVVTFSHTPGSGTNRLTLVGIAVGNVGGSGNPPTVTVATLGGTALTLVGTQRSAGATGGNEANVRVYIYRMLDSEIPGSGGQTVSVTLSGAGSIAVEAVTYTGVDQTTPLGTFTSTNGSNPPVAFNSSSATNELVFSLFAVDGSGSINSVTVGAGQSTIFNTAVSVGVAAAASTEPGAATVTSNYDDNLNQDYALGVVSIKPAPAAGTTTATFTQTLSMASDFAMPAGGVINVVNYVNVVSGSMPANPSITATLKYGSTTIATLTNPVYSSGAGTLTWTHTLSSNVTIPAGSTVTLDVTTAQSGVTFQIQYDSSTKPSRIDLPTTTYLDVNSVGIYDAAYTNDGNSANDGNAISSAFNGETVYIRALVTDPFGPADITSELLTITPPTGGSFTLSPTSIIPTGTLNQKIYEYAWTTSVTQGTFAISVTANEGYEGTIFDTAGTTFVVAQQDLGTPSITEFVDGSGVSVTEYLPDSTAYIRITDIDQNMDAGAIETITATVTTSTGDTQTTTFTETGANTGVFTASLPITSTGPATANDGSLYAPDGATLFVNYTDPDDSTDQSSDTAMVASVPLPPNTTPTAVDDSGSTDQDTVLNVIASGVMSNDSDPDVGQSLTVVALNGSAIDIGVPITLPSGALLTLNSDGSYSYSPNGVYGYLADGQTATDSFNYTASDSNGGFATATVTITITGLNDAPVSTPIPAQSNDDADVIALTVAGSFADNDIGDILTFMATGLPTGLSINPLTGLISGTIDPSASQGGPSNDGVYSVEITATDVLGVTTSQTFAWTVTNPSPDARDNAYATIVGTSTSGNVLTDNDAVAGVDSDPDGDVLSVIEVNGVLANVGATVTGSNGGAFIINSNGSYSFDPGTAFADLAIGQTRSTTVTYTLSDGNGGTDVATVAVTVTGINDAPVGSDSSVTTPEDTDFVFNATDFLFSDVDGDTLAEVRIDSLPADGTLLFDGSPISVNDVISVSDIVGGLLVFRPIPNENGTPYTTFGFSVGDGLDFASSSNVMTVNITPDNDPPTTTDTSITVMPNVSFPIDSSYFSFSDIDVGDSLQSVKITTLPASGTLALDGVPVLADQDIPVGELYKLTYTAPISASGAPFTTFDFQVSDGTTYSGTATVTINVVSPDLAVTVDDFATALSPGQFNTYAVRLRNNGLSDATGVVLTVHLPTEGLIFLTTDDDTNINFDSLTGELTWTPAITSLAPNGQLVLLVNTQVRNPIPAGVTAIVVTAAVSSSEPDLTPVDNSSSDTDTVDALPDLRVTTDDGGVTATAGDTVVYTVTYQNHGNQDATGAYVIETVPAGSTFDSANSTPGWTNIGGNDYRFDIGDLAAGASGSILFAVKVDSTLPAGQEQLNNTASINDDGTNGTDPTPADNSDSDVTPLIAAPDLSVTKTDSSSSTTPGASIVYTLTAANNGTQDATGVVLTETLPDGTTFDSANSSVGWYDIGGGQFEFIIGNLSAGTSTPVLFAVTVTAPAAAGHDDIVNNASIADDGTNGSDPIPGDNSASDTDTLNAAPDYQVTIDDGQTTVTPGQSVTYQVTLTNVGNQDGTGVVLSNLYPKQILHNVLVTGGGTVDETGGTIDWNIGDLAVGESRSFTITADVRLTIPAGWDTFEHSTTATDDLSNGADATPANNTASDTDILDAAPDLLLTKDDSNTVIAPGQVAVYVLTKQNVGNQDATNVIITETVPVGTTFFAAQSDPLWVQTGPTTYQITEASIPAGFYGRFLFSVLVDNPAIAGLANIVNTATFVDDGTNGSDPTPSDNTTTDTDTLDAAPDYQVTIDDGEVSVTPGQSLSYTINFTNAGDQHGTGVVVTNSFPTSILENVVASDGGVVDSLNGTITWNVGNLNVGDSRSFTVTADVRNVIPASVTEFAHNTQITDDLSNGSDPTPANNSANDTDAIVASPAYQITIDDGQANVVPGQSLTYSVQFTNTGSQDGTGIIVTDSYPIAVLENVIASDGGVVDTLNGTITWNVGNLAVGDSRTFTVTAQVRATLAAGINSFVHSTSIDDDHNNGADPDYSNNISFDTDILDAAPDLQFVKSDGLTTTTAGASLIYTMSYSNVGSQDSTGIELIEELPAGTTFDSANSTAGWTLAGGSTYRITIGSLAAGASGSVYFAVTVNNPVVAGQTEVINTAYIIDDTHNGTDPNPGDNGSTDTDSIVAVPDYSVTISNGVAQATPGQTLDYSITFQNNGTQNGTGVVMSVTIPSNVLQNITASDGGLIDLLAGTVTWNIGSLSVGSSGTFHLFADVKSNFTSSINDITLQATIDDDHSNGDDPTPSNNSATDSDPLDAAPDYLITIDDGQTEVRPGDLLTYQLNVTNQGNQDGTGVIVTDHFPPAILQDVVASNGGVVDQNAGTITWTIGNLPVNGSIALTVTAKVRSIIDTNATEFTHSTSVTDDLTNGSDPTPLNNFGADTDKLLIYSYDSFHDWLNQQFAAPLPISVTVGRPLSPLPVDPIFSGLTEPGTTLVGRIYDAQGHMMGERLVVADSGGNWLMSFPNIIIFEHPHRMEIIITPAISNSAHENGFNLRRYFHPAIHTELYCNEQLSVSGVFRNRAYNIIDAMHSSNTRPLGFDWFSHAYELSPASTNVAYQ